MQAAEQVITENLDIWTSAVQMKSASGRGKKNKLELYGIKKLRELILELAVRGFLVPQDPNDEPASELLKKIAAEKAQLVKDGKIRKQKALPPVDEDEQDFVLPTGWEWCRLADTAYSQAGFAFKSKGFNESGDGLPLVRIRDVGQPFSGTFYDGEYREEFVVREGDYLISMDGNFRVAPWEGPEALLNQRVSRLIFFGDLLGQRFIAEFLQLRLSALQGVKAYTTVDHLSGGQISSSVIALPPSSEQFRIVAKVDELMALCDQLEQRQETSITAHQTLVQTLLNALTTASERDGFNAAWARVADHFDTLFTTEWSIDRLKQTILKLAVMGKLVPQGADDEPASKLANRLADERARLIAERKVRKPKDFVSFEGLDDLKHEIPECWTWTRLGDVAEIVRGGSPRPAGDSRYYDGDIPFLKVADVTRKTGKFVEGFKSTIKEAGLHKTRLIEVRTVLLSNSGATLGIPAICDFSATFNDGIAAFVEKSKWVDDEYLYAYLSRLSSWFLEVASRGQGQPNLNTDIIRSTWLALPPLEEQRLIVKKVDKLMDLCCALVLRLNAARTAQQRVTDAFVTPLSLKRI